MDSLAPAGQTLDIATPDTESPTRAFDIIELVGGTECLQRTRLRRTGGTYVIVGVQSSKSASLPMLDLVLFRSKIIGTTARGRSNVDKAVLVQTIRDWFSRG